jgi:acetyl esterase/lipase
MAVKYAENVDPRIKKVFGDFQAPPLGNFASREELIATVTTGEHLQQYEGMRAMLDATDNEEIAPSEGLRITKEQFTSQPDGNQINIQFIRPDNTEKVPCVYYIHGGGMEAGSCFWGCYRAWGKMIAAHGVAVAMVDFRNSVFPSSAPEVAPFPAGFNDCHSGVKWIHANAAKLGIDTGRVVIAGESGGGNLTLAVGMKLKRDAQLGLIKGLYALCPFIGGQWPNPDWPSSIDYNRLGVDLHNNRFALSYGVDTIRERNPLAWPIFATEKDVEGLPPVVIQAYEFDPLRDEGIAFYRLLLRAGVNARCTKVMGATHAIEIFPIGTCPEISRDTARNIAAFCKG